MNELYLVKELVSDGWEDRYERTIFSSFDEKEAIDIAKAHFIKNEVEFIRACEIFNVQVIKLPVGHVEVECCVWSAAQDLQFASKSDLAKSITIKPTFSVLWDDSLEVDAQKPINLKYFHSRQMFVIDARAIMAHISRQKADDANELAWALFDRYEKNAA